MRRMRFVVLVIASCLAITITTFAIGKVQATLPPQYLESNIIVNQVSVDTNAPNVTFPTIQSQVQDQNSEISKFCNFHGPNGIWYLEVLLNYTDPCEDELPGCPGCPLVSQGTYSLYNQNQISLTCSGFSQTFQGMGGEPFNDAWETATNRELKACIFTGGSLPPQPQTIEQKRAFRKSDQQVAAELAALREQGRLAGWTFDVGDSQAFRILLELLNGTIFPENFRPKLIDIFAILAMLIQEASQNNPTPVPPQPAPNPNQLPSHFDAREWGVVPAIRFQGDCGSCWAFAAVSSQEITFASRYQQPSNSLNLSEQQLLSCNSNGYSCQGGSVTEQDSDYRYESGLVGEQTYPYEAQDSPCRRFSRPNSGNLYDIRAFDFVLSADDDVSNLANITKIKQAIYSYGNVWAGVFADQAFQAYDNGVFNACSGGRPDHAINIIGWDDAGGYWIIRNSWNSDWGDNGYAKVKYGCNAIGQSAAVPKLPQLADCNGGNCQPRNASPPPWLRSASSNPVTPPFQPNPAPVPPTESSPPYPLW